MRQQRRAAGTRSLDEVEEQTISSMIMLCFLFMGIKLLVLYIS